MEIETISDEAVVLELIRLEYVALGCPIIYPDNDKDPMPLEPESAEEEAHDGR